MILSVQKYMRKHSSSYITKVASFMQTFFALVSLSILTGYPLIFHSSQKIILLQGDTD